jgi:hypothetical protein
MKRLFVGCLLILVALLVGRPVFGADMETYRKHITNYHKLLQKADELRAKGKTKNAEDTLAKAEEEKALADVALHAAGRLPEINEPGPIVYYDRPYYGYWGYGYWRGPWWYPYGRR